MRTNIKYGVTTLTVPRQPWVSVEDVVSIHFKSSDSPGYTWFSIEFNTKAGKIEWRYSWSDSDFTDMPKKKAYKIFMADVEYLKEMFGVDEKLDIL
jgi:hypothetical protein